MFKCFPRDIFACYRSWHPPLRPVIQLKHDPVVRAQNYGCTTENSSWAVIEGDEAECKTTRWSCYRSCLLETKGVYSLEQGVHVYLILTGRPAHGRWHPNLVKSLPVWVIAAVTYRSPLHITGHEPLSVTYMVPFLFHYPAPFLHLLHLIILSPPPPHTRSRHATLGRPWHMYSTIALLCHNSLKTADGLCSRAPPLTEFTAVPSLSPASHLPSSHLEENQFFLARSQSAAAVSVSSVSLG